MKGLSKSLMLILSLALITWSCQPDNVKPKDQNSGKPTLSADVNEEEHPEWAPDCSGRDTFDLRELNGNQWVDYCGFLPCSGQQPKWGFVEVYNTDSLVVMNFSLATGWFVNLTNSQVAAQSSFQFDQNGVPIPENNWILINVNPLVNLWQIVVPTDSLSACAAIASKNAIVQLDFLGNPDPNSTQEVWMYNPNYNNMANPLENTTSPWLTGWCVASCAPDPNNCTPDYTTYTQCQWGICGADGDAAAYRDANFANCFPSGLAVGCDNGGFQLTLTSATAVNDFLPTQGRPVALTANLTDPVGGVGRNSNFRFCPEVPRNPCGTIDFNTDGIKELNNGAALSAGTFITDQWRDDIGMLISGESNHSNRTGDVIIFDSNNPTGGDFDLGTPNQAFGGPGIGAGGAGGAGVNNVNEGNLLILAENVNDGNGDGIVDNPDDDAAGGKMTFSFDNPITIQALTFVDLDDGNQNKTITIFFADSRPPLVINCPSNLGDNSRKVVLTKEADNSWADNVQRVEVDFPGSGAIAGLCFCFENPYTNNACVTNSGQRVRNTLAGRAVATTLNVEFDACDANFGAANFPFGYMEVRRGPFQGMTVNDVLAEANNFLGGCGSTFTANQINSALRNINNSFREGVKQSNYLICPVAPAD